MKDFDQNFSPLAGLARKQVTRRTFLAGVATATAATALADNSVYDYRLVFNRDDRAGTRTIRQDRRSVFNPGSENQAFGSWELGEGGSWTIPAAAFGPNARFRLNRTGSGIPSYKLFVTALEFGRNTGRSLYFEFAAGAFEPYTIALWTDLWSLTAGPDKTDVFSLGRRPAERNRDLERQATPVLFSEFVSGDRQGNLYQWVANGRIASTFQLIFNGLLNTRASSNQDGIFLSFSPECVWRVADSAFEFGIADAPPVEIIAFDGDVALKEFRFAWCRGLSARDVLDTLVESEGTEEVEGAVLLGIGTPATGTNDVVLALNERTVTLNHRAEAEKDRTTNRRLWVQAGYPPEARDNEVTLGQVEAQLALTGHWSLRLDLIADEEKELPAEIFDLPKALEGVLRQRLALARDVKGKLDPAALRIETFFEADFVSDKPFRAQSPVGPLLVQGVLPDRLPVSTNDGDGTDQQEVRNFALSASDALAPRRGAAVRLVASRRVAGDPVQLRWFEANLHLLEVFRPLKEADFSRLTFAPTSLMVIYAEDDALPSGYSSFVSLRRRDDGPRAQIDLDRARLAAGSAGNLVHLTFRFQRMALALNIGGATIAPLADVCRVTRLDPGEDRDIMANRDEHGIAVDRSHVEITPPEPDDRRRALRDDRAILVVEFPPQHVMEQAFFRLDPGSPQAMIFASEEDATMALPGGEPFNLTRPREVLNALKAKDAAGNLPSPQQRKEWREAMLAHYRSKVPEPGTPLETARARFDLLENAYRSAAGQLTGAPNRLPVDQTIYLGPYGLDADAMGALRRSWADIIGGQAQLIAEEMIGRARKAADEAFIKAEERINGGKGRPVDQLIIQHAQSFEGAQALAVAVAGSQPGFQRFRTFYREAMIDLFLSAQDGALKNVWDKLDPVVKELITPTELSAEEIEFVWLLGETGTKWPGADIFNRLKKRYDFLFEVFAKDLSGNDSLDGLSEARLARPSRLAFHVNCQDRQSLLRSRVPELGRAESGDSEDVTDEKRRFGIYALDFSLQDLTRWSGFEMSVTRRAQALTAPDLAGRVDALSRRQIDDGGGAILDALGFPSGRLVSSAEWNAHLMGTLQNPPTPLETSIEIPARLTLSPDQGAVFLTPQLLPESLRPDPNMEKLWAAKLDSEGGPAAIRAVHSPDLRPQVFARPHQKQGSDLTVPGLAPPPRGPLAPWLLDRFDGNAEPGGPWDFAQGYVPEVDALAVEKDPNEALCMRLAERETEGKDPFALPRLVDWLCARRERRKSAGNALKFRSALDAAVRHELVLLSSGEGMRVVARRNRQGQLLGDSQFLAEPRHQLYDLQDGSAIYKPRPFSVEELELTSLGGSYRAMASFEPPAGAKTLDGRPLFPALSVERYQHWVVLGRDIFVEVLFKGFLLPFGHRASLVQVTERRFMRDPLGNITAYLVQRMYIQRGIKTVRFPGLGQPYQGRMMPFQNVSILSERSPDIVDPYGDPAADAGKIGASGRLGLPEGEGMVGTVFWPRTAKSAAANVRFELQLDDKFSTLPLLFVDNTAANDPDTLKFIVEKYYNKEVPNPHRDNGATLNTGRIRTIDPAVHLSTLQLGGGKLRYAEEDKAGSCSLDTESICISLTGQNGPSLPVTVQDGSTASDPIKVMGTRFILENHEFSPILQGADRVPAYPAMETARLYLRQNERLTGRRHELVRASFDAHYVMHGLPVITNGQEGARQSVQGNLSEIFLSLIDMPSQNMGAKGDQSGGVMRPATELVALSRLNGPVGVAKKEQPDPLRYALDQRQVFHHTAELFDAAIPAPVPTREGLPPAAVSPSTGGPRAAQMARTSQFGEVVEDAKAIYEKYFSDDAKLLGLISIRELVVLVVQLNGDPNLIDPRTGMPKLNELIRYGGGRAQQAVANATDAVEDAAGAGVNFVRVQIVEPLDATLVEVLEIWQETDTRIRSEQQKLGGLVSVVGLDQLLPGLNDALRSMRGAVQEALAETDDILFALSLGAAFEAGRRLIDTVGRILAEIDEIVADAVGGQVRNIIGIFETFFEGLDETLKALAREVLMEVLVLAMDPNTAEILAKAIVEGDGDTAQIAEKSAEWLAGLIVAEGAEEAPFVAFPVPPLDGLDFGGGTMASGRPMAEVVLECLVPTNKQIRDLVIAPFFKDLMLGVKPEDALETAKGSLTNVQAERTKMVEDGLATAPGPFCGDEITSLPAQTALAEIRLRIETYRRFLADAEGAAKELLEETTDRAVDVLYLMFKREIDLVLTAQTHLQTAGRAVRSGNLLRAAQSAMAFVELFTGPLFDADAIQNKWASAIEVLIGPVRLPVTNATVDELGLFDPSQLTGNPTALCTYDSVTGLAQAFEVNANYTKHNLSTRIYQTYDKLRDAKTKAEQAKTAYEEFRNDDDIQKVLDEAAATSNGAVSTSQIDAFLSDTSSAINRSVRALDSLKTLTGLTYCDLVNDSLSANALIVEIDKALDTLKTTGDVAEASRIPERIEALMRSRQRLVSALMVRLRASGDELRTFLEDQKVQRLIAAGAAGLLVDATGLDDAAKEVGLEGKALFDDLQTWFEELQEDVEEFLFQMVQKLDVYLRFVIKINGDLFNLSGTALDTINELISPFALSSKGNVDELRKIQTYLEGLSGDLGKLLDTKDGTDPKRVTIEEFQGLTQTFGSRRVPLLEFIAPKVSGPNLEEDFVRVLRGLQAEIETMIDDLIDAARDRLRREVAEVLKTLDAPVVKVVKRGISFGGSDYSLVAGYAEIKKARDEVYAQLDANTASKALAAQFLVLELGKVRADLGLTLPGAGPQNTDRLAADLAALKKLGTDGEQPISDPNSRAFLRSFLQEWGAESSTPHLIGSQVLDVIKDVLRGDVLKLLPLDQIRDEIEDRILEMVPNQITQSFAFKTNLPKGIEDLTAGIFVPGPGSKLNVGMKIDIDLFPGGVSGALDGDAPEVQFNAFGSLGAFDIKLVGQFLDALTLHFDGARFTMSSGAQRRFDVEFRDFTIGRDLEFVAQLADMLNPGGSGPYVVPARGFPGIEAGYGLNIGTFMIGNMSVFNVSLNAAAILPFDSNPTRFRASLSRRDAPFTISYAPYGGSGFFAIEADADGIVGFEASFEFGGAGAFAIGPLTGQGRAMVGFYIRQTRVGGRRMTELAATVFVGGSANIWIFSFGASLYVRLGMTNGNMTGLAVFTYSFSIGIKDFDFTIEWRKQESKGFSGEQASYADPLYPIRFADSQGGVASMVTIERDTVCQSQNWPEYQRYFDNDLDQKGFLDGYFG